MQKIAMVMTFLAAIVMAGCGGGSSDSSFSGSLTKGGVTYECSSQSAFDKCSDGDCGSCSCTSGCPDPDATVITKNCSVNESVATVTSAGCIVEAAGTQTVVCVSDSAFKMLGGTGHTAAQVTSAGSQLSGGVTLGGVTLTCAE